jgi:hypothetical protein
MEGSGSLDCGDKCGPITMSAALGRFPFLQPECKITFSPLCGGKCGLPAFRQQQTALNLKEIVPRNVDPCHPTASWHDHQAQQ